MRQPPNKRYPLRVRNTALCLLLAAFALLAGGTVARAETGLLTIRAGAWFPGDDSFGDVWLNVGADSMPIPGGTPILGGFRVGADYFVGDGADMWGLSLNRRFGFPKVIDGVPGLYAGAGLGWYSMDAGDRDGDGFALRLSTGVEFSRFTVEGAYTWGGLGDDLSADGLAVSVGFRF